SKRVPRSGDCADMGRSPSQLRVKSPAPLQQQEKPKSGPPQPFALLRVKRRPLQRQAKVKSTGPSRLPSQIGASRVNRNACATKPRRRETKTHPHKTRMGHPAEALY